MKQRHIPNRICIVCRETSEKKSLLRVVRRPASEGFMVAADPSGKANGRGAYVCASDACIEKAIKQKRFERSLGLAGVGAALPISLTDDLKALAVPLSELSSSTSGASDMS